MGPIGRVCLTRGISRTMAGARPGMLQTSASLNHHLRRGISDLAPPSAASQGRQCPSLPPTTAASGLLRSCPVIRQCLRSGVSSSGALEPNTQASRKRPPGWRSVSTGASDASNDPAGRASGRDNLKSPDDSSCWKCDLTVSPREYFCECGAAQPLDGRLNYFEMFGCPPAVHLDLNELEKHFKNMQRAFHPDLFASKSEDEQAISAANSAMANKVYQTLGRPMSRVKYLMRLLGSNALEENGRDDQTTVPPDFLMEVMETRESLERCSSKDEAAGILAEASVAVGECLRNMDEILKAGGGKDELAQDAVRLRYLYRIEEEARSVMHRLEDEHSRSSAG